MGKRLPVAFAAAALLVAAIGFAPIAEGHGVFHAMFAHNADKVDGKHAASAAALPGTRAGKLVATNAIGQFPTNIVPVPTYREVTGPSVNLCSMSGPATCSVVIATATCPSGHVAIGGGWRGLPIQATVSHSKALVTAWALIVVNNSTFDKTINAVAYCAPGRMTLSTATALAALQRELRAARATLAP